MSEDEQSNEVPPGSDLPRRTFLRRAGLGAGALLGGAAIAHDLVGHVGASAQEAGESGHGIGTAAVGGTGRYGHGVAPPLHLPPDALDAVTIPPAPRTAGGARTHEHEFVVTERTIQVAEGVYADAWTYAGTAPGPVLRATEGDLLRVRVVNRTDRPHNLHFHGRHTPGMDGWEPIPPGSEFTYEIEAGPAGLHPYHCHVPPLSMHISKGMYGALIVDPPGGRPPAHEFVLVLSGWDVDGDGHNEVMAFNGIGGFFHTHPLKVPVGEPVRVHLLNMTEYEPIASFHLHAQTFDVHRSGTGTEPDEHTDTVTLGQGERAILEFTLPERGRYMFHPHQHHLAEMGAMGWFSAI
jgi:FtsP/CotA-like multicopper oxidase with cupredoxin domain